MRRAGPGEYEIVRLTDRTGIVAVITVNGVRELKLHARGSEWIERYHHEAQDAITTHDVQVVVSRIPRVRFRRPRRPPDLLSRRCEVRRVPALRGASSGDTLWVRVCAVRVVSVDLLAWPAGAARDLGGAQ
jgi:hypothetical protein